MIRVVKLGAHRRTRSRRRARKARSSRICERRGVRGLLATARRRRQGAAQGWYFTGDTGYFDRDGDLFVTGRVDDMIITGGENVSPVEIESCLSLHPACPRSRWSACRRALGQDRRGVRQARARGERGRLDQFCRTSGLANFKRPRRYVFVERFRNRRSASCLRRKLVAGEYQKERA
jgi:2-furoate---CoA ligase